MEDGKARAGLREHFGSAMDDEAVLTECLSILRSYNLPPSELFYKFEAYLLAHPQPASSASKKPGSPSSPRLTLEIARELRKAVQREVQGRNVQAVRGPTGAGRAAGVNGGVGSAAAAGKKRMSGGLEGLLDFDPTTPAMKRTRPSAGSSSIGGPSGSTPRAAVSGTLVYNTPTRPGQSTPTNAAGPMSSPLPTPTTNKFATRTNALSTTDTLNPHLAPAPVPAVPHELKKPRIAMSTAAEPTDYAYRYMFEKVSERAEVIDARINTTGALIRSAFSLTDDFLDPADSTGTEEVYTVGQICTDSGTSSKLNDASLVLQTSRAVGAGGRVPLRFSPGCVVRGGPPGVKGVGFFVGGVWGFRGRNGSGEWFEVTEILVPPLPDMPGHPPSELLELNYGAKLAGAPAAVFAASGPYTLDADLEYAPFAALVEEIKKSRPDVVILLGPFVSSAHPLLKTGAVTETPADIFRTRITAPLLQIAAQNPACNIILVPSVRDLVGDSVCFPQGMFDKADVGTGAAKRIRLLPNPCVLNINEVSIAVSSVDTLFHLRKDLFFKKCAEATPVPDSQGAPATAPDMIANVCRSVLSQRSFYPLYPVPQDATQNVNLDLTHYNLLGLERPDVLILPSQLAKFAKVVDSVVVVNPGRLSQFSSGGTFAKLALHPMDKDRLVGAASATGGTSAEDDEVIPHDVFARCRVEIVRI